MDVEDLDVLRPEPRAVRIGGQDIDVSYIPCGITFEVDAIVRELWAIPQEALAAGGDDARRAFDLSIRLCAVFCYRKHPEMDEEWFRDNVDAGQLRMFAEAVRDALARAYKGSESGPKNRKAARTR